MQQGAHCSLQNCNETKDTLVFKTVMKQGAHYSLQNCNETKGTL